MSTSDSDKRGAGVKFPPPLLLVGILIAALGIHRIYPFPISHSNIVGVIGLIVLIVALLITFLAARAFRQAKTAIEPWRSTSSIISSGVFAYSRNPIYLGFCLIAIGIGMIINSWWILLSFIPLAALIYQLVIKREEAYLEQKFGDTYLQYKTRVRRWL